MNTLKNMIRRFFGSTRYAKCSDILGQKSGGTRDLGSADWRALDGNNG